MLDVEPEAATQGINHVAMFAKDLEATAAFYSEVMGMPVVGVIPNRDVPGSTHMNVAISNGMTFSFFDFPHVPGSVVGRPRGWAESCTLPYLYSASVWRKSMVAYNNTA